MEKWRRIGWTGAVLGIVATCVDRWAGPIPYEIIIPVEIISLILILSGLIIRKREKTFEKQEALQKEET